FGGVGAGARLSSGSGDSTARTGFSRKTSRRGAASARGLCSLVGAFVSAGGRRAGDGVGLGLGVAVGAVEGSSDGGGEVSRGGAIPCANPEDATPRAESTTRK